MPVNLFVVKHELHLIVFAFYTVFIYMTDFSFNTWWLLRPNFHFL